MNTVSFIFLVFGVMDVFFSIILYLYLHDSLQSNPPLLNVANSKITGGLALLTLTLRHFFLNHVSSIYEYDFFLILSNSFLFMATLLSVNAFKSIINKPSIIIYSHTITFLTAFSFWSLVFILNIKPGLRVVIFSLFLLIMTMIVSYDFVTYKNTKSYLLNFFKLSFFFNGIFSVLKLIKGLNNPNYSILEDSNKVDLLFLVLFLIWNIIIYFGFVLFSKTITDVKLITQANTDYLTGLLNRQAFFNVAEKVFSLQTRKKSSLSLLYIDIDFFKNINDSYGHTTGDNALIVFANLLTQTMRKSDFITRLGGEEFAVLMFDTPPEMALVVAERFRKDLESLNFNDENNNSIKMTASIGVYGEKQTQHSALEYFVERADSALMEAKRKGRNRVINYDLLLV
ncbi:MAG: hypothetical protein B7Z65_02225 [Ferrovum sp. 21-44-67]|nr:MAG: hypothetical protein B7Z65_02225 [Ferrovum sp. 21-44-67]